jgi:hypothetical protein
MLSDAVLPLVIRDIDLNEEEQKKPLFCRSNSVCVS